jgi:hypothetical protein
MTLEEFLAIVPSEEIDIILPKYEDDDEEEL